MKLDFEMFLLVSKLDPHKQRVVSVPDKKLHSVTLISHTVTFTICISFYHHP